MATEDDDFLAQINSHDDGNRSYLEYLEGRGAKDMSPLDPQYLAIQAEYLQILGKHQHPIDVLRRISLNPWVSPKDRMAACKTLMEYAMQKVPSRVEMSGVGGKPIQVDQQQLRNLSDTELEQLTNLLEKANAAKE